MGLLLIIGLHFLRSLKKLFLGELYQQYRDPQYFEKGEDPQNTHIVHTSAVACVGNNELVDTFVHLNEGIQFNQGRFVEEKGKRSAKAKAATK